MKKLPKQLLRDTVALWLNTASLEAAIMVARDMRSCTRTVVITPNFFLAHGPSGVRCFYELGITDVVLDMRLLSSRAELWQCVTEAAKQGIKAITVSALAGAQSIQLAVEAAEASKALTHKIKRPRIFVSALPHCITDAEMVDDLQLRVRRAGHVTQAAKQLVAAGADGILIEYDDVRAVRKAGKKIPLLIFAQRRAYNYMETPNEDERKLAGITEIMKVGGSHVILDSDMLRRTNVEWAADMVNKELEATRR